MARGLLLGMRCTSTSLRSKWASLVAKLLRRVLAGTYAALHRWHAARESAGKPGAPVPPDPSEKAADLAGALQVTLTGLLTLEIMHM